MTVDLLFLLFLLLASAFFSGSEMAYILSNKFKMEVKARQNNLSARSAHYFINNPEKLFSTILIGNNISNIAYASISAVILASIFQMNEWEILITSTVVLLILSELIPKYLARELPNIFFLAAAVPLRFLSIVLAPFVKAAAWISRKLTNPKDYEDYNIANILRREDLELLLEESEEAGNVDKKESDIIKKVIELRHQRVEEAMRPRTDIVGVDLNAGIEEVLDTFIESGFSKLPVYDENLDNIKGFILAYDIFKKPEHWNTIIRDILFVPETKRSIETLNDFLQGGGSIAVVVDEFGGTAGIVTVEDIIEELFGEIKDEYDIEEDICRKVSDDTYITGGKVEVDFINEKYELELPEGNYQTIAGLIMTHIGRIPMLNENIIIDKFNFLIVRADQIRIDLVKITRLAE